jgi:hypothetical protein
VSELSRLGIKLFAVGDSSVPVRDFVPIFHSWIQKQSIKGHQLIDVHDYSHIHNGPGILLVAHEGNFSTDMAGGRLGLAYFRKLPAAGTLEEAMRASLQSVRDAASLLESESSLGGRMRFRSEELMVVSNDRLLAPNEASTFAALTPTLAKVFGAGARFTHASAGTRDRLTIQVAGLS